MITQENRPCWIVDGLPGDTEPHHPVKAEAVADLRRARDEDHDQASDAKVRRLDSPCWTVRCDGECEMAIDEEEDGLFHFASPEEALRTVRDWEWVLTDHEHVFCPGDAPPHGKRPPLSPAEQEAAGQLALPVVTR